MDISLNPVENLEVSLDTGDSIDISLIPSDGLDFEIDHVEDLDTDLITTENLDIDLRDGINVNVQGSVVIPNPPDIPTDDLETVKIDEDTFKIKDPDIHDWARNETKPNYTPEEIGAVDADNELAYAEIDRMFNAVFGI